MSGEEVACAAVSTHLWTDCRNTETRCYPPPQQLRSDFGGFHNGVCHVMKITMAQSNRDIGLITQQTLCFSLDVLVRANKRPIMTSVSTDRDPKRQFEN